ncbi:sigma-54-dependent Fis family transcriptional regulator [Streptomyces sp. NPDC058254]|uniref:sigma-54-dependent Fis family transcriptional regulator n=1 Tax=Streptomyces sp. NPDC058254 TaxID=3346406 RepID=UPI0036EB4BA4
MSSTSQESYVGQRTRPEIASSWTRSRLNGLREDTPRLEQGPVAGGGRLVRAAGPVLDRAKTELDDTSLALLLADRTARVVDFRCADRSFHRTLTALGVVAGVRLGEDQVGTNAVGTPVETRQGLLVRGAEHFAAAFHGVTCYGHPIIHPVTRRIEGVLNIGGPLGAEDRLFAALVRRMVRDIEDRLQLDSSQSQLRLLAAFQTAARSPRRPVLVVGQGLVLATPHALDLLEPVDHAAVQACAEGSRSGGAASCRLTLNSGRTVRLTCTPIDGVEGVLVDILAQEPDHRATRGAGNSAGWPLLVVGEPGSGRSTEARQAAGPGSTTLDATDAVWQGEQAWATVMAALLEDDGPTLIIENIQHMSERMAALLAKCLRGACRDVVLTSTPGDHLDGPHAWPTALCNARRDLVPLRRRRHEIPQLAQRMLADASGTGGTRLTADTLRVLAAHPWPGNLAELRRVIHAAAGARSAGDIIASDLPTSYRNLPAPASPFRQAEREIIVAAIEAAGGNKLRAARTLGVSRSTLYNRMRALHIY